METKPETKRNRQGYKTRLNPVYYGQSSNQYNLNTKYLSRPRNNLRFYRLNKGWTRHKLADVVSLKDHYYINRIERGDKVQPTLTFALKLACALDTTVDKLFQLDPKIRAQVEKQRELLQNKKYRLSRERIKYVEKSDETC